MSTVILPEPLAPKIVHQGEYVVQISDLRCVPGRCACCGGPRPALVFDVPEHTSSIVYGLLGGLTRYLGDRAAPCGYCELLGHVGRLIPRPQLPAVESPADAAIREMREASAWRPPPESPTYEGLFDPGTIYATPLALDGLAKTSGRPYDPSVNGLAEAVGGPRVPAIVARHVGRTPDGDAAAGAHQNPLASEDDRAADALATGRGTIRSLVRLDDARPPTLLRVRTALDPDRGNLTLVYVAEDGVDA